MKKAIVVFSVLSISVVMLGFNNIDSSRGALGDVKYSILSPREFAKQNGNGWVLMDDKVILAKSDLQRECGVQAIPDARGVFIRGVNLKRDNSSGDADGKREAGSYQADALQGHHHMIGGTFNTSDDGTNPIVRLEATGEKSSGGPTDALISQNYIKQPISDNEHGEPRISNETRPKNIALYTYIKINR